MTANAFEDLPPAEHALLLDQIVEALQATSILRPHQKELAAHHLQAAAHELRAPAIPVFLHRGGDVWEVGAGDRTACVRITAWAVPLLQMTVGGRAWLANAALGMTFEPDLKLADAIRKQCSRLAVELDRIAPALANALRAIEVSNKAELSLRRMVDVRIE